MSGLGSRRRPFSLRGTQSYGQEGARQHAWQRSRERTAAAALPRAPVYTVRTNNEQHAAKFTVFSVLSDQLFTYVSG